MIAALVSGLVSAIPDVLSAIWDMLKQMVAKLKEVDWLAKGKEILTSLLNGLKSVVSTIISSIKDLVSDIWNSFKELPGKMLDIGSNIVSGIWEGISGAAGWLWDQISGFCEGIWDGVKDFFGINSPSKLFKEELGYNLVYGFAEGIDDKVKNAVNAVNSMGQDVMKAAERSLRMDWNVSGLGNAPKSNSIVNNYYNTDNSRTVNQTNNSPKSLSRLEILRQTKNALRGVVV